MRYHHRVLRPRAHQSWGFTLVEVLLAAGLGSMICLVAADALITHLRTSERLEANERLRLDWSRTSQFIEAEVALSERVLTTADNVSLEQCGAAISSDEFRFALELRRDLAPAIYYVRRHGSGEQSQWLGEQSLWRCGPPIAEDGTYSGQITGASYSISNDRLVDGLTASCGLTVENAPAGGMGKSLSFRLCLQGLSTQGFTQSASTYSRISPVFSYPTTTSLCSDRNLSIEGFYKLSGGTAGADLLEVPRGAVPANQDVLICGYGGGDTIHGSSANDVLEGGDQDPEIKGANIEGLAGNDRLRGTVASDVLDGGEGDDVLVGWSGNDLLKGGTGENRYLPGLGNDSVIGGPDLDVVFLELPRTSFSGLSACSRANCSLTYSDGSSRQALTMSGVEVLIFRDGRTDLR